MRKILTDLIDKLRPPGEMSLHRWAAKCYRYAVEIASAPVNLRDINEVGQGARTLGRPSIDNQGFIRIEDKAIIHSFIAPVELRCGPSGRIVIGKRTFLNYGVSVVAQQHVEIGQRVLVGPYVTLCDTLDPATASERGLSHAPIVIEDDVWIGAKATIKAGVRIGRGAIVGVSAVVGEDVPPFAVVVGQPARVIKQLDPKRFVVA